MATRAFQLSGTCNNYDWGKKGEKSLAAQLCARTPGIDFTIENDQFYSEMWFGNYPDFPARVLETGEPLADVLKKHKETLLGKKVIEHMDSQLPFLPKILSIDKALPLQIHPNKALASKLHEKHPDQFTDDNHKPEIAVALSKFELFAGFQPLRRVARLFSLNCLKPFVPKGTTTWTDGTLREVTRSLLKAEEPAVRRALDALAETPTDELDSHPYIHDLVPRLREQYGPADPGTLVALTCMNFLELGPGDAVYIPADGIHAYLSGNIVECMARSNNVLNVGFCPRPERDDVDLFADTMTFRQHTRGDVMLAPEKSARGKLGRTIVYDPPMSEFEMLKTDLGPGEDEVIKKADGPGVFIVTQGKGMMEADGKEHELSEGFIFFVAPGVEVRWKSETGMQIHMAVV